VRKLEGEKVRRLGGLKVRGFDGQEVRKWRVTGGVFVASPLPRFLTSSERSER
jgi:hypothetical protein